MNTIIQAFSDFGSFISRTFSTITGYFKLVIHFLGYAKTLLIDFFDNFDDVVGIILILIVIVSILYKVIGREGGST